MIYESENPSDLDIVNRGLDIISNYVHSEYLAKDNFRPMTHSEEAAAQGVAMVLLDVRTHPEKYAEQGAEIYNLLLNAAEEDPLLVPAIVGMAVDDRTKMSLDKRV